MDWDIIEDVLVNRFRANYRAEITQSWDEQGWLNGYGVFIKYFINIPGEESWEELEFARLKTLSEAVAKGNAWIADYSKEV